MSIRSMQSVEAFESKEYLRSFYALLDYINAELSARNTGMCRGQNSIFLMVSIVVNFEVGG